MYNKICVKCPQPCFRRHRLQISQRNQRFMLKKSENLVSAPNVLRGFQITMMTINSFVTGESWLNFQVSFCLP